MYRLPEAMAVAAGNQAIVEQIQSEMERSREGEGDDNKGFAAFYRAFCWKTRCWRPVQATGCDFSS